MTLSLFWKRRASSAFTREPAIPETLKKMWAYCEARGITVTERTLIMNYIESTASAHPGYINAIRAIRERTGCGLREGKELADVFRAYMKYLKNAPLFETEVATLKSYGVSLAGKRVVKFGVFK